MKRKFLGKHDPDRISLMDVFDVNDGIIFSTPLNEEGRVHRVFAESSPPVTRFLADVFMELANKSVMPGRWCGISPEEDGLVVLAFDRMSKEFEKNLTLLTGVLYMDLACICGLRVSNCSQVGVFWKNQIRYGGFVALPKDVPNGTNRIPTLFVPHVYVS